MAQIYLARQSGLGSFERHVVLKTILRERAADQRFITMFLDEAKLAARIHHPNVVAIQDLGKIGDDYVIVMDYVEGVDLERLLASARQGAV